MHAYTTLAAAHVPEAHHLNNNLLFSQSFVSVYWWLLSSVPAPLPHLYNPFGWLKCMQCTDQNDHSALAD